jgi:hypothetical protein
MARPLMKQSLLAHQTANVSNAIEHKKGFAVLQNARAIVGKRRTSQNIKMIFDLDYILQN